MAVEDVDTLISDALVGVQVALNADRRVAVRPDRRPSMESICEEDDDGAQSQNATSPQGCAQNQNTPSPLGIQILSATSSAADADSPRVAHSPRSRKVTDPSLDQTWFAQKQQARRLAGEIIPVADYSTKLDPDLASRFSDLQVRSEAGAVIEDIGSLADKCTQLNPELASRLSDQQMRHENGVSIEDVGSRASNHATVDPELARRFSDLQIKSESGIDIPDIRSLAPKTSPLDPELTRRLSEQLLKLEQLDKGDDEMVEVAQDQLDKGEEEIVKEVQVEEGHVEEEMVEEGSDTSTHEGSGFPSPLDTDTSQLVEPADSADDDQQPPTSPVSFQRRVTFSDIQEPDETPEANSDLGIEAQVRWMWADAGLSRRLAKRNPFRWSRVLNPGETVAMLKTHSVKRCMPKNCARPVRMEIHSQAQVDILEFESIDAAISHLNDGSCSQ